MVLVAPPVTEIAVSVELAPLIVEAVSEFVTDHRADAAEIHGIVGLIIVERRLQDASRKRDVVL